MSTCACVLTSNHIASSVLSIKYSIAMLNTHTHRQLKYEVRALIKSMYARRKPSYTSPHISTTAIRNCAYSLYIQSNFMSN